MRKLKNIDERREFLEKELKISLATIGNYSADLEIAASRNCENMIGATQIPLGVAGPLRLRSGQALKNDDNYFIPLATTEGALVASINRGCKAIIEAGGANVFLEKIGITRGPVFKTKSLAESFKLKEWLARHFNDINYCSKQTSDHLELLKIESQILGRNVYVRFYFETDQAMGMNMATIATQAMISLIEEKTNSRCLSLSGNFCVDKKPAWSNFLLGRGKKVWAEAVISGEIVQQVLKTTPEKIYEVWLNKCMLGSALSGSMAFNAHYANVIAAFFAATGQDLAHVAEASLGVTTCEVENRDLYFSVYLPDLPIGVVGGGTSLVTQKEALAIIFGQEKPSVEKLSQVIAGAVLAGELSLLASLAEGSLACSHQRLGRGTPPFAKASGRHSV